MNKCAYRVVFNRYPITLYEVAADGLAKAKDHFAAHRARLQEFHARGVLLMVGPFSDRTGAMGFSQTAKRQRSSSRTIRSSSMASCTSGPCANGMKYWRDPAHS
ncbi:MAG: hypothetical protein JWP38_371 [Herbaspirillum sp.]|jgi:uncharacterized protein YciI|nr:hypothetical protein [Herbaspirillum sp.]